MGQNKEKLKKQISIATDIIRDKKAIILSDTIGHTRAKIKIKCELGHVSEMRMDRILHGHWCKKCSDLNGGKKRRKYNIEDARELAKKYGGECLSSELITSHDNLTWKCSNGHIWDSTFKSVKSLGCWCIKCYWESRRDNIDYMKEMANDRGGECLSDEYINAETKLKWRCELGHVWRTKPSIIKSGSWCPYCISKGRSEKIFRHVMEDLFSHKFPRYRADLLRNKNGNKLELDGYYEDLKLGFEYQGFQHFSIVHWDKSYAGFKRRIDNDLIKKKLCKEQGIHMMFPSYNIRINNFRNFVVKSLYGTMYYDMIDILKKKFDFSKFYRR